MTKVEDWQLGEVMKAYWKTPGDAGTRIRAAVEAANAAEPPKAEVTEEMLEAANDASNTYCEIIPGDSEYERTTNSDNAIRLMYLAMRALDPSFKPQEKPHHRILDQDEIDKLLGFTEEDESQEAAACAAVSDEAVKAYTEAAMKKNLEISSRENVYVNLDATRAGLTAALPFLTRPTARDEPVMYYRVGPHVPQYLCTENTRKGERRVGKETVRFFGADGTAMFSVDGENWKVARRKDQRRKATS